jgi:hypothetical protein
MLQLLTGKRPGKRAMEVIRFYMMSHAESEEIFTSARFGKISQVRFNPDDALGEASISGALI